MRIDKIELLVYDFDGVMTDNTVYLNENGIEMVKVNRSDGLAISLIKDFGIKQIIISSEKNSIVEMRARKVGIECIYGVKDKVEALIDYANKGNIELSKVAFVGNEINDLEVMKIVGFSIAPFDAHNKIKELANYVTNSIGGGGVIREIYDLILMRKEHENE